MAKTYTCKRCGVKTFNNDGMLEHVKHEHTDMAVGATAYTVEDGEIPEVS